MDGRKVSARSPESNHKLARRAVGNVERRIAEHGRDAGDFEGRCPCEQQQSEAVVRVRGAAVPAGGVGVDSYAGIRTAGPSSVISRGGAGSSPVRQAGSGIAKLKRRSNTASVKVTPPATRLKVRRFMCAASQPVSGPPQNADHLWNRQPNQRRASPFHHGFVASAQKSLAFSTARGSVKPASMSVSVKPLFVCPE